MQIDRNRVSASSPSTGPSSRNDAGAGIVAAPGCDGRRPRAVGPVAKARGRPMTRALLNRALAGMGTTIFAEMSALAAETGSGNLGQGFPGTAGPAEVAQAALVAILAGPRHPY